MMLVWLVVAVRNHDSSDNSIPALHTFHTSDVIQRLVQVRLLELEVLQDQTGTGSKLKSRGTWVMFLLNIKLPGLIRQYWRESFKIEFDQLTLSQWVHDKNI